MNLTRVVVATSCLMVSGGTLAQEPPRYMVELPEHCASGDASKSAAWNSHFLASTYAVPNSGAGPLFRGFPLNLSLSWGIGPGDFPAISNDEVQGTLPLVPGTPRARTVERPTRALGGGVVDLITGAPLLRDIDLELAFGSAVYRHVRTYGEGWSTVWHENEALHHSSANNVDMTPARSGAVSEELFWDWHGQGWMIGENPMFLFDAEYLGISAVPA